MIAFNLSTVLFAVALAISAFAEFYSILGLMAIFSGAAVSLAIIGSFLGIGKIVTIMWIRQYWHESNKHLRTFLLCVAVILSLLTNIGMFGFLSKAHSTSSLETDSVQLKLDTINDKLKTVEYLIAEQENRRQELQDVIDTLIAAEKPTGADRVRKTQQVERQAIDAKLTELREQRNQLKIEANGAQGAIMHLEADVGPIKYLAQLVYGEKTDKSIMDKAIQILIIALVCVIDPLAIALVLAASWTRQYEATNKDKVEQQPITDPVITQPEPVEQVVEQPEVVKPKRKYTRRKKVEETPVTETSPFNVNSEITDKMFDLDEKPVVEVKTSSKPAKQAFAPKFDIQTKQIIRTFNKGDYIQYNGKKTHIRVVRQSNPEWFLESAEAEKASMIQFSADNWPQYAEVGDKFHRIDVLPHIKYEFTAAGWVEINNQIDPTMLVSIDGYVQAIAKLINAKWFKLSDFDPNVRAMIKQTSH